MQKCYLCDSEIDSNGNPFKIGLREEVICEECHTKTINRRKTLEAHETSSK